jgi:hypothetical protein
MPTLARSPGVSRSTSSLQARPISDALPTMLPLTSISTMRRMGCGEFWNTVSGCSLPLSNTWKSSRPRLGR